MHGDMLASARAAYLAAQGRGGMSPLAAYRRLRKAHDYIAWNNFSGDGDNNLVILDYRPPTPVTNASLPAHFLYGLNTKHIDSVVSRGILIVKHGRMTTVNEDKIRQFTLKQTERLWRKL